MARRLRHLQKRPQRLPLKKRLPLKQRLQLKQRLPLKQRLQLKQRLPLKALRPQQPNSDKPTTALFGPC